MTVILKVWIRLLSRGKKKRIHKFDNYFVGKTQIIRYNEIKKKGIKEWSFNYFGYTAMCVKGEKIYAKF